MSDAAEKDADEAAFEAQNQIVIIDPVCAKVESVAEMLERDKDTAVHFVSTVPEATQIVTQVQPCLVLLSCYGRQDIINAANFLKSNSGLIRQKLLRTIIVSKLNDQRIIDSFAKLGCTEFIMDRMASNSLFFKMRLQLKALRAKRNEKKDDSVRKFTSRMSQGEEDDYYRAGNTVKDLPFMEISEDVWLVRGDKPKKSADQWVVDIEGPTAEMGEWMPNGTDDAGQRKWLWAPKGKDGSPRKPTDAEGFWEFSGNRPLSRSRTGKWRLAGKQPSLSFTRNGEKVASKFELGKGEEMELAADSPQAFKNLEEAHKEAFAKKAGKKKAELDNRELREALTPFLGDEEADARFGKPTPEEEDSEAETSSRKSKSSEADEDLEPESAGKRSAKRGEFTAEEDEEDEEERKSSSRNRSGREDESELEEASSGKKARRNATNASDEDEDSEKPETTRRSRAVSEEDDEAPGFSSSLRRTPGKKGTAAEADSFEEEETRKDSRARRMISESDTSEDEEESGELKNLAAKKKGTRTEIEEEIPSSSKPKRLNRTEAARDAVPEAKGLPFGLDGPTFKTPQEESEDEEEFSGGDKRAKKKKDAGEAADYAAKRKNSSKELESRDSDSGPDSEGFLEDSEDSSPDSQGFITDEKEKARSWRAGGKGGAGSEEDEGGKDELDYSARQKKKKSQYRSTAARRRDIQKQDRSVGEDFKVGASIGFLLNLSNQLRERKPMTEICDAIVQEAHGRVKGSETAVYLTSGGQARLAASVRRKNQINERTPIEDLPLINKTVQEATDQADVDSDSFFYALPIIHKSPKGNRVIGVLYKERLTSDSDFSIQEIKFLRSLNDEVSRSMSALLDFEQEISGSSEQPQKKAA